MTLIANPSSKDIATRMNEQRRRASIRRHEQGKGVIGERRGQVQHETRRKEIDSYQLLTEQATHPTKISIPRTQPTTNTCPASLARDADGAVRIGDLAIAGLILERKPTKHAYTPMRSHPTPPGTWL
jgi:hypothetical protein